MTVQFGQMKIKLAASLDELNAPHVHHNTSYDVNNLYSFPMLHSITNHHNRQNEWMTAQIEAINLRSCYNFGWSNMVFSFSLI